MNIKSTKFEDSIIEDADFSEANLTGATFGNCDLRQSVFNRTVLEKVDFRTAHNFSIDPEENRIKKAKFSKENIRGLLTKHDIIID